MAHRYLIRNDSFALEGRRQTALKFDTTKLLYSQRNYVKIKFQNFMKLCFQYSLKFVHKKKTLSSTWSTTDAINNIVASIISCKNHFKVPVFIVLCVSQTPA
jgi:hypothetical protein